MIKLMTKLQAAEALDDSKYRDLFSKRMQPINQGWVIRWKDQRVKPDTGQNDTYASRESALASIKRNIGFTSQIAIDLAESLGIDVTGITSHHELIHSEPFRERLNLQYLINGKNANTNGYWVDEKTLNPDEQKLRIQADKDLKTFDNLVYSMLDIMLTRWIKVGTLEIIKM